MFVILKFFLVNLSDLTITVLYFFSNVLPNYTLRKTSAINKVLK